MNMKRTIRVTCGVALEGRLMKHTNWVIVTTLAITLASFVLIAGAALSGRGERVVSPAMAVVHAIVVIGAPGTPGI